MAVSQEDIQYRFMTEGVPGLLKEFKTVSDELKLQTKFVNDLAKTQGISKQAAEKLAQTYGVTGAKLNEYNQGLKAANKEQLEFARSQKKAEQSTKDLTRQIGDLEKGLIAAGIAGGAFAFLKGVATDAIAAQREFQKLSAALASVSKTPGEDLAFLNKEVDRLSISLPAAAQNFVQLSAAAKGTIIEGQGVRDTFSAIAGQGRVLGLSNERQAKAFLALTQVISKGRVQAEELTGQLSEALPGATQKFAAALGVSTKELLNLVKAGQVGLPELLKFVNALNVDNNKNLKNAGDTIETVASEFETAVTRLNIAIGKQLEPAFKTVANTLTGFIDGFLKLPEPIQASIIGLGGLAIAIGGVGAAIVAFKLLQISTVLGAVGEIAIASTKAVVAMGTAINGLTLATAGAGLKAGLTTIGAALSGLNLAAVATVASFAGLAIIGAAGAAFIVYADNVRKANESLDEFQTVSDLAFNSAFASAEKTKNAIDDLNNAIKAQGELTASQLQDAQLLKVANDTKLEGLREQLKATKDIVKGETEEQKSRRELLVEDIKIGIKSLETQQTRLKGILETQKVTVQSVKEIIAAYDEESAALTLRSAKEIASAESSITSEKDRAKAILEIQKKLAEDQLALNIKLQNELAAKVSGIKDPKNNERIAAEKEITKLQNEESKLRVEIAQNERNQRKAIQDGLIKDLEDAEKLATEAVIASATARGQELLDLELQIGNQSLEAKSQLRLKDLDNQKANIEDQIKLEQDKIAKLEALQPQLTGDAAEANETKIRAAKQKTAELAGQLTKNEIEQNKAFAEQAAIPYENQAKAIQRNIGLLDQQNKLREAGQAVISAQYDAAIAGAEREISTVNEGIKLRGELATADGEKREAIIRRLGQLGQSINESEADAVKRRQVLEDNLARLKQKQLEQSQAADRAVLEASLQRVDAENKVTLAITRGNAAKLQGKDDEANAAVKIAQDQIDSQDKIAAKQREGLAISQEAVLKAAEKTEEERKYGQEVDSANAKTNDQKVATQGVGAAVTDNTQKIVGQGTAVTDNTQKILEQGEAIEGVAEKTKAITAKQATAIALRNEENRLIAEANKKLQETADLQIEVNRRIKEEAEFRERIQSAQNALNQGRVGVARSSGGGLDVLAIKTVDENILKLEELNLLKELAKTEEERAAIQVQIDAIQKGQQEDKLSKLKEEISLNAKLLEIQELQRANAATNSISQSEGLRGQIAILLGGALPGFRSGVEGFEGGLARVHAGEIVQAPSGASAYIDKPEVLMNLPRGTNVYTANQVKSASAASLSTAGIEKRLDKLIQSNKRPGTLIVNGPEKIRDASEIYDQIDRQWARRAGFGR